MKSNYFLRKTICISIVLFNFMSVNAQDYNLSFTGSGENTVVDSVIVENLTQSTTLKIEGSDILNLVGTLSIDDQLDNNKDVLIYPNPMDQNSRISFYTTEPQNAEIIISDMIGRILVNSNVTTQSGNNFYEISNLPSGTFVVNISTQTWQSSLKLISTGEANDPKINSKVNFTVASKAELKSPLANNNTVQMQYNDGDQLLLKGYAGNNITYFPIVPTQTQTIDFEFIQCEDLAGNNYPIVIIGTQKWMARNLNFEPNSGNSWCYNNDPTNCDIYGRLYDWPTLMNGEGSSTSVPSGVQGLCPTGWHLPSDGEWTELATFLGGDSLAGGSMKSTGTSLWDSPNQAASNSSGFTALPSGVFIPTTATFANLGSGANYWSTTEIPGVNQARVRSLSHNSGNLIDGVVGIAAGLSCRCIKD